MKKKSDNGAILFKAGIFIIFTLALLIFSVLWLRFFSFIPEKTIKVKFAECGPIPKGMPTYYHGVNIGKIDGTTFSKDFKYTLVTVVIYKKHMDLPKNVYAEIKTTGLTGQSYLEIFYPDNPSKEILKDGDTIEGRLSDMELLAHAISIAVKDGTIKRTLKEVKNTTINTSAASKKADQVFTTLGEILSSNRGDFRTLINESALSASNFHATSNSVKTLSTSPELQQNIKLTASNMSKSSQKLDKITTDVDKVTGNCNFQQGLIKTSCEVGNFTERLNEGDLNCSIKKTLENTDKTINRYDCIGNSFSDLMSQRFLLFKLMFGKPGESFEKCKNLQCIEEEFSKPRPCFPYSCPNK
jgi:ABC-type transporter Mla subunit MlaD